MPNVHFPRDSAIQPESGTYVLLSITRLAIDDETTNVSQTSLGL